MAGTIIADTLTHSTAGSVTTDFVVNGSAKVWVLYDQTNNTNRGSNNISSITDTSTGLFTLNYTNSFSDGYYATTGSGNQNRRFQVDGTTLSEQTASAVDCRLTTEGTTVSDITTIGVNIHGDLA
jgi:hypothetical protein